MSDIRRLADDLIESGNQDETNGDLDAARLKYQRACDIAPEYGPAWINLGIVYSATLQYSDALGAFDYAIRLAPTSAPAHYNRGLALAGLGDVVEAEHAYRIALFHRPTFPDAYAALADVLEASGLTTAAVSALGTAIAQAPSHPGYLLNLGLIQKKTGQIDESERSFRAALDLDKSFSAASIGLAGALREKGAHLEACAVLDDAIRCDPNNLNIQSNLLFTLLFRDDLDPMEVAARHRRVGSMLEQRIHMRPPHTPRQESSNRRLRMGYVSGDFRRHAVAFFALPVIEGHDRSAFEVICYSNASNTDDVTDKFKQTSDEWRDISSSSDSAVAELIDRDEIDILVDLSGHSAANRLSVFVEKPAPVQVTWLGYLSTTGLSRIDYRISDRHTDTISTGPAFHSETLVAMPNSQWCYRPYLQIDHALVTPAASSGAPTFGSFNQFSKVSRTTMQAWIAIMNELPLARLFVVGIPEGTARTSFLNTLKEHGIQSNRIRLAGRLDLQAYYRTYDEVDIALDTTPYSGATTTCDALWMGVPVVTLSGQQSIARSGVSLMNSLGLNDLVASTTREYVTIAVALAKDRVRLAELRGSLRDRMLRSSLMNEKMFVRDLEDVYRKIWIDQCGKSPYG